MFEYSNFSQSRTHLYRYGMGRLPADYRQAEHTCTKREEDQPQYYLKYANLGVSEKYNKLEQETCWNKKYNGNKYQEGYNPFCGTEGLCCRFKKIKNKNSACDPHRNGKGIGIEGKRYHHCVKP